MTVREMHAIYCRQLMDIQMQFIISEAINPPGLDGLPGEFYKRFWETIEPHFNDIFYVYLKEQKNSKQLFHITLLFKKKRLKKHLKITNVSF